MATSKAQLDAAKARVAAATKAYQNTPSYAANYAQVKQENDSAINALNKLQEPSSSKKKSPSKDGKPGPGSVKLSGFTLPGSEQTATLQATAALKNAQEQAKQAQNILDTAPVGSDLFKKAQADLEALTKSYPDLQSKATAVTTTEAQTQAKKEADQANANLADLKARAAAGSENAKAKLADAQKAADAANKKAGITSQTSTTGTTTTTPASAAADAKQAAADAASVSKGLQATGGTTKTTTGQTKGTATTGGKKTTTPTAAEQAASTNYAGTDTAAGLAKYGIQAALIDSDPSLKKLFTDAMANGWDVNRFKAEFLNTSWAKNNSATWQNAETARFSAPGDYANSYNRMREYIARVAAQNGETLTPDQIGPELKQNADGSWPTVTRTGSLAEWALDQSWGKGIDAEAIAQHIAQTGKINTSLPGGQAANYMSQLKSLANDYGLNGLNTSGGTNYFTDAAQSILLGKSTIDTWKQDIINQAKQNYKAYAPQLDAGITLRSLANPYINSLSNLLELPSDSIDLSASTGYGKMISDALRGTDPNNPNPMTLNQFETQVKQDPRWATTNNARDQIMGGVGGLLKMFGKIGA